MNTPDTEWSDLIINLGVEVDTHQDGDAFVRTFTFNDAQLEAFISSRDTYWKERVQKDNLMGMIVKNSTGFDTVGNQRLWHLDIDAFEADLDTLLDNLK